MSGKVDARAETGGGGREKPWESEEEERIGREQEFFYSPQGYHLRRVDERDANLNHIINEELPGR